MKKNDSTAPLSLPVFRQISAIAARQDVPAFVVGGYVRDFYLGRPSTDIDVVVVGSGIGLAVCDEIVNLHGGKFDIGNAEGGGTVVTIRLPLKRETEKEL